MDERKMSDAVGAGDDAGVSRERKRHSPRQIVDRLRDAEVLLDQRMTVTQIAQRLGMSEVDYSV